MDDERTTRQRRLAEVGDRGQARIAEAVLQVRGTDGAIVETEYLCRAGVERVTLVPRAEPEPFAHQHAFRFAASRRIGAGAWRALGKLRLAIGMGAR